MVVVEEPVGVGQRLAKGDPLRGGGVITASHEGPRPIGEVDPEDMADHPAPLAPQGVVEDARGAEPFLSQLEAGLLAQFPTRGCREPLLGIQEAARQSQGPLARRLPPPNEEHAAALEDEGVHRDEHRGIGRLRPLLLISPEGQMLVSEPGEGP